MINRQSRLRTSNSNKPLATRHHAIVHESIKIENDEEKENVGALLEHCATLFEMKSTLSPNRLHVEHKFKTIEASFKSGA